MPVRRSAAMVAAKVSAGFPSPAEDYGEGKLDLNEHLITRPAATFIITVEGRSMTGAGIFPGDLLVVDRSVKPKRGDVVIAVAGGDLTVKRLEKNGEQWLLKAENPDDPAIAVTPEMECVIWGVVTSSIRRFRRS